MAGPLTWRNVDSPDFRPALQGFAQFSQLLNQGLGQASQGLKEFDDVATDQVNRAFALELAGIQGDPETYKAGLQTLLAKFDPARLSYENITAANNKYGQLQTQAQRGLQIEDSRGDLTEEQRVRAKNIGQEANWDAVAPFASQLYAAQAANNPAAVQAIMDNPEFKALTSKLSPEQFSKLITGGQNLVEGELDINNSRQRNNITAVEFKNRQEDRADQQAAQIAAFALLDSSVDAESYRDNILNSDTLTDRQKALAFEIGISRYGNSLSSLPGVATSIAAAGSSPAGDPTRIMNYEARDSGFATVPASVKTLGQASDFALQVNDANRARTGEPGSSAMGVYQIVGQTMRRYAPQVLGENWREAGFNFENQDKIAEAIFNDHKGSAQALRNQWVSLSLSEAERIRRLPWSQAREVIAGKESSSSPAALSRPQIRQQAASANSVIANNINGNRILEVERSLMEGWTENTPAIDVADSLVGPEGPLAGADRGDILGEIRRVAREANVSPAIAGAILRNSVDEQGWLDWLGLGGGHISGLGRKQGLQINQDDLNELIRLHKDRDAIAGAAALRQRSTDASSAMGNIDARIAAAEQKVLALQTAAQTRNVGNRLAQAQAELAALRELARPVIEEGFRAGGATNPLNDPSRSRLPSESVLFQSFRPR
jgi:hypothetical protein